MYCRQVRKFATALPKKWKKPRGSGYTENYFVDYTKITVKGGNGGDGRVSFARLWCNPFAGPDGGDGGNGGHVIFQADAKQKSLNDLKNCVAPYGEHGKEKHGFGGNGEHLYLKVPVGTTFRRCRSGQVTGELNKDGEIYIGARGGAGGHGNRYYLSNENRAPDHAEQGALGETVEYEIELRVMAHAGLVGFPNAGKSTLLRAVSRARPKVACYPFTTQNPLIGTVEYEDCDQLTVADIPGLLPGYEYEDNCGMGTSFLKHIERCLCLFYVIDLSLSEPWVQLDQLKDLLESHHPGLSSRLHAVVANKCDLPQSEANLEEFSQRTSLRIFPVSAKHRRGIEELLVHFKELYDDHKKESLEDEDGSASVRPRGPGARGEEGAAGRRLVGRHHGAARDGRPAHHHGQDARGAPPPARPQDLQLRAR
jgi:GTP-binding protein